MHKFNRKFVSLVDLYIPAHTGFLIFPTLKLKVLKVNIWLRGIVPFDGSQPSMFQAYGSSMISGSVHGKGPVCSKVLLKQSPDIKFT
jgi:hypothetical protein